MRIKRTGWIEYVTAVGVAVIGAGLLMESEAVSQGIQSGLKICAGVLIPSLFPFMVLSGFLSLTSAARILSIPLTPLTTKVFKLPAEFGATVLLSLIGGYPVGAKNVSMLLSQGKITAKTAERMLCFCVNAGPSFLIAAVGSGILHNQKAGVLLFCTQTAATLILGALASLRAEMPRAGNTDIKMRGNEAFVAAASGASAAMLVICTFAVLFSGVLSFISASGIVAGVSRAFGLHEAFVNAVISGLLEVTAGCAASSQLNGMFAYLMISATVSFGGLSVLFQIISCFKETKIDFRPLILTRICHMVLSVLLSIPLYKYFFDAKTVFAPSIRPVAQVNTRSMVLAICLLCMCVFLTLSTSVANKKVLFRRGQKTPVTKRQSPTINEELQVKREFVRFYNSK